MATLFPYVLFFSPFLMFVYQSLVLSRATPMATSMPSTVQTKLFANLRPHPVTGLDLSLSCESSPTHMAAFCCGQFPLQHHECRAVWMAKLGGSRGMAISRRSQLNPRGLPGGGSNTMNVVNTTAAPLALSNSVEVSGEALDSYNQEGTVWI